MTDNLHPSASRELAGGPPGDQATSRHVTDDERAAIVNGDASPSSPTLPAAVGAHWRSGLLIVGTIIVLDQITKALVRARLPVHESVSVIPGLLALTHVRNSGAAFGFLNSVDFPFKPLVIALVATAALVGIAVYAAHLSPHERVARLGLSLILGGATGNLIDRLAAGAVVDFVDVYWRDYHFWAFNVADAAITVGVALMVLDMLGLGRHVPKTP